MSDLKGVLLEQLLKDKDFGGSIPNGEAFLTGKSIDMIDDTHYTLSFKIAINNNGTPGKTAGIVSNVARPAIDSNASPASKASIEETADKIITFSDISDYMKTYCKPFLFTLNERVDINKKGIEYTLQLPHQIIKNFDSNGNPCAVGLFDFKLYWARPEKELNMILMPERNVKMLDQNIINQLDDLYEYKIGNLHFERGGIILPVKTGIRPSAILYADGYPFVIVDYGKTTTDIAQNKLSKAIKPSFSVMEKPPGESSIRESAYYSLMKKFDMDSTTTISSVRALCPPVELIKQHLGENKYIEFKKGKTIDDIKLLYHKEDERFDSILIPQKNYELLLKYPDSSSEFLKYFNNEEKTQIRRYDTCSNFQIANFLREKRAIMRFYAKDDFYVRIQKIGQNPDSKS